MRCRILFEIAKGTADMKYEKAKEVVITMALRKTEQRRPKKEEIMTIERRRQEEEGEFWAWEVDQQEWYGESGKEDFDVDAVGRRKFNHATKCHRCGGIAHMARECASSGDMLAKGGVKVIHRRKQEVKLAGQEEVVERSAVDAV